MSLISATIEEIGPGPLWQVRLDDGSLPYVVPSRRHNKLLPGHEIRIVRNENHELQVLDGDALASVAIFFSCAKCQLTIAGPLRNITTSIDPQRVSAEEPLIPVGSCLVAPFEWPFPAGAGQFIMDLNDVYYVQRHPDETRFRGCCGPDGSDGINTICFCGHELGIQVSECIFPHFFALRTESVIISRTSLK